MKHRELLLTGKFTRILVLVAILAALSPPSLHSAKVSHAKTETLVVLDTPTLTEDAFGANSGELRWTPVSGAVGYELWLSLDNGATRLQRLDDGDLTGTSYKHSGCMSDAVCNYAVRATDAKEGKSRRAQLAHQVASTRSGPFTLAVAEGEISKSTFPEERAALAALFKSTDGANWKHSDNWLTELPISNWYGVSTDASGRVTALDLSRNGLHGPLPNLSALTRLEWLSFSNNRLTGPIPDLSALTGLSNLDLNANKLSGPVPDLSALTNLEWLSLSNNRLTGPIPDLSALTGLYSLDLSTNKLSGLVPDLSALTNLEWMALSHNRLTGPIPDLNALTKLTTLDLASNQLCLPERLSFPGSNAVVTAHLKSLDLPSCTFVAPEERAALVALYSTTDGANWKRSDNWLTESPISTWYGVSTNASSRVTELLLARNGLRGPFPDLSALTSLTKLYLASNQLTGRIPALDALTSLEWLSLSQNQLTGPIFDLNLLTRLNALYLSDNRLTGPAPDLSAFTNLAAMRLTDNQFCLSPGFASSGPNAEGAFHLKKLNLATCTDAELSATPAAPSNLTPNTGGGKVALTWDRVLNTATYELRAWDSLQRQWGPIGGVLTGTSFTHSVLTDGRNYYYQVRSRDASGGRSAWSERVYAAVVPPLFPPPPESLGLDIFYQKYLEAGGVVVVAPSEVSDKKMAQAQEIMTGLLSHMPGLLETLADNRARIAIFEYKEGIGGVIQLPEFRHLLEDPSGMALRSPTGWVAAVPEDDYYCGLFVHEFAHLVHFAIEVQLNSGEYISRLIDAYNAAMNAGLWQDEYASTNTAEYFAEVVKFWLWGSLPEWLVSNSSKLEEYDPDAAKLVKEVFGEATVPWYCKP